MRRRGSNLTQSSLDSFFRSSRGGTGFSLLPERAVPSGTAATTTAALEYTTVVSSSSDASTVASSASTSRSGSAKRTRTGQERHPAASPSTSQPRRVSPRSKSPTSAHASSRGSSVSDAATSSTESYNSSPDAAPAPPAAAPQYTPPKHAAYLAPPETKAQKVANDALAYGQRSIILPWSSRNVCAGEGGQACDAWTLVRQMLREDRTASSSQLRALLQALMVHFPARDATRVFTFDALADAVGGVLTAPERAHFYAQVLPWMKHVAAAGGTFFGSKRVPLLRQGTNSRVVLSHNEAVTLMCCAFFSLFPGRSYRSNTMPAENHYINDSRPRRGRGRCGIFGVSSKLPPINFDSLLCSGTSPDRRDAHLAKIRCVFEYFFQSYAARDNVPMHTAIEIARVCYAQMPDFIQSRVPLQTVVLRRDGLIEEDAYALQVDFANKVLGGGVLGRGCVQEEIRFVVSPELILSRLVCESLLDNEAVFMGGCGQFSAYTGYSDSFRFDRPLVPGFVKAPLLAAGAPAGSTPGEVMPLRTVRSVGKGRLPMLDVCVVAMDAVDFNGYRRSVKDQYYVSWISREMRKAFVSFNGSDGSGVSLPSARQGPVATGNWGSGAFGGDVELKLLIQWCAASEAARPLHYYAFDRMGLPDAFAPLQAKLSAEGWTVGNVFTALTKYAAFHHTEVERLNVAAHVTDDFFLPTKKPMGVFDFVKTLTLQDLAH